MPTPRIRRGLAAALALGAVAGGPAVAQAATVTVTGDDGNPVGLTAGAPATIRNMKPDVGVAFPPGRARYSLTITDQAGNAAGPGTPCIGTTFVSPSRVTYRGNGTYTATVVNYAGDDSACARPLSTESYQFAIAASTAVTPAGPFLLREAGSFTTSAVPVVVGLNPGADGYEVHVGRTAAIAPGGDIAGAFVTRSADAAGNVSLRPDGPGVYTVVARARIFAGAGEAFSPWSAPVQVVVKAPFDFEPGIELLDRRGPSYRVRASLREASARGQVTVALARGRRGGAFRSIGRATISTKGTITKRFRATRTGTYRLRFRFRGSQTIAPGSGTIGIRVTRTFSFGV